MALRYTLFHISHIKICYLKTVVGHGGELVLGAEGNTVAHGLPHTFDNETNESKVCYGVV